jgi:hypothetical protein
LLLEGNNRLYIADIDNNRIRLVQEKEQCKEDKQ